jgi:hypothetical protein
MNLACGDLFADAGLAFNQHGSRASGDELDLTVKR